MSIATALQNIQQDITNARAKIVEKGGTVTASGGSSHLATDIATIPSEINAKVTQAVTDDGKIVDIGTYSTSPATDVSDYALTYLFSMPKNLTTLDLSSLTGITGNYALYYMIQNMNNCVTTIDLSGLKSIKGSAALQYAFTRCDSLRTVTIGGTEAIDFGSYTNQFYNMFSGITGGTLHGITVTAPNASKSVIEAMSGYPRFGASTSVTWNWR